MSLFRLAALDESMMSDMINTWAIPQFTITASISGVPSIIEKASLSSFLSVDSLPSSNPIARQKWILDLIMRSIPTVPDSTELLRRLAAGQIGAVGRHAWPLRDLGMDSHLGVFYKLKGRLTAGSRYSAANRKKSGVISGNQFFAGGSWLRTSTMKRSAAPPMSVSANGNCVNGCANEPMRLKRIRDKI